VAATELYVTYRVDADEDGLPCLEFYATSRMTNDRHARIRADGRGEHLAAVDDVFSYDPDASTAAKKAAYEEFERRNREITDQLRARGLHPQGPAYRECRCASALSGQPCPAVIGSSDGGTAGADRR
jgi:hypothetical protein